MNIRAWQDGMPPCTRMKIRACQGDASVPPHRVPCALSSFRVHVLSRTLSARATAAALSSSPPAPSARRRVAGRAEARTPVAAAARPDLSLTHRISRDTLPTSRLPSCRPEPCHFPWHSDDMGFATHSASSHGGFGCGHRRPAGVARGTHRRSMALATAPELDGCCSWDPRT